MKIRLARGVVISAVGAKQLVLGDEASGPARSTMKIPLTITASGDENPPTVRLARGGGLREQPREVEHGT
jgi:hypothetical protein